MPDTTAKIRAKGLDATGVTEEVANQLYTHKGSHYMGIVEFRVEEVHEKADGTRRVDLILTQVEPALDTNLEDHLRELTRTLYYNRGVTDGQPTLPDSSGPNPTIEDMISRGEALIERDDDGQPVGLWDGDPDNLPDDTDDQDQVADTDHDQPVEPIDDSNVVTMAGTPLFLGADRP